MYRIIIEDEKGLHEGFLDKSEAADKVVKTLIDQINMKQNYDYIIATDIKNYNGMNLSIHGNGEKIAKIFDGIVHHMICNMPGVVERVLIAWDKRK